MPAHRTHLAFLPLALAMLAILGVASGCAGADDSADDEDDVGETADIDQELRGSDLAYVNDHRLTRTVAVTPDTDRRDLVEGETAALDPFAIPSIANGNLKLTRAIGFRVYKIKSQPAKGFLGVHLFGEATNACKPAVCVTYADGSATCRSAKRSGIGNGVTVWNANIGDVDNKQPLVKKRATSIIVSTAANLKAGSALAAGRCSVATTLQGTWYAP